jgi:hypothetical protein
MEKTVDDILAEVKESLGCLLDGIRAEVDEALSVDDNSQAEEYSDEQGYEDGDEESAEVRTLLINAYTAGRDAALSALEDAVNEVKVKG